MASAPTPGLGTGDYMLLASNTFAMAWHAAHGGNWGLAEYYLRRTRGLFRRLKAVKPKYETQLDAFEGEALAPLLATASSRDLGAFDAAFEAALEQANGYHLTTGHSYIRWRVPAEPPERGLDLASE